jgi:signal transduction histidine kinase
MPDTAMMRRIRSRIGQSLGLRFALTVALLMAAWGGALVAVIPAELSDTLTAPRAIRALQTARRLAEDLRQREDASPDERFAPVRRELPDTARAAVHVARTDAAGYALVAALPGTDDRMLSLLRRPTPGVVHADIGGVPHLIATAAADADLTRVAVVSVPISEAAAAGAVLRTRLLGWAALLVVLATAAAGWAAQRVLHPLRELADAMRDVSEGKTDRRLAASSRDEAGRLAVRFNAMARAVERHRVDTARTRRELEHRVSQRTQELEQANSALRSLDRAKDSFLSNVSHEMRTPLTSILASIEILRKFDGGSPEERAEFLGIVDEESRRLLELIDSVLEIAALEAAPLELERTRVPIENLVDAALSRAQAAAQARGLTLIRSGQERAGAPVDCDAGRIGRILDGLLDNAIKFSPHGATVDVRVRGDATWSEVCIRDEGPGLDPRDTDRVFGLFAQAGETMTAKPDGFGLGLPVARRIAEAHGGTITCEREPGFGATFVLKLPRRAPAALAETEVATTQLMRT